MPFDAYLKIEGMDGEATDEGHEKWIELLSYSHGVQQEGTSTSAGGAHTSGRVDHGDIVVSKLADTSSPELLLACCNGKSHGTATIEFCRAGEAKVTFMKVELTDVVIGSVRPYAAGGADFPGEDVTLKYGTIKWTYTKTNMRGGAEGDVVTGWDLAKNKKL